ncbi:MAG: aminotransferase class IV [Planctomycetota bacterium]
MVDQPQSNPDPSPAPSGEASGEVFINGQFVQREGAMLSAFDASVQHGIGLFETMRAGMIDAPEGENIGVFRLTEHLERLQTSARELGLSERLRIDGLADAIIETVRRSGVLKAPGDSARVRMTITGGDLNLLAGAGGSGGVSAKPGHQAGVMIVAQPATAYPDEMYTRGVRAGLSDWKTNAFDPFASHKTIWYWPRLRELQTAAGKGFGEALVFTGTNHLAGGCVSNAFIVRDATLVTPIARGEESDIGGAGAIPSPVLPGVTRGAILDWADEESLTVERRMVVVDDVLDADEVFLTNASWGVMPVIGVESKVIAEGTVGPITTRALAWWRAAVRGEG